MVVFSVVVTLLLAAVSFIALLLTAGGATSAPQEAAGAAMAIGFVVIPYVWLRCFDVLERRAKLDRVLALLEEQARQARAASTHADGAR